MTRILLVEDNPDNQEVLARLLTRRGYELEFAEDGIEAVRKAREMLPALILMDLSLPEMDGYEATRRIKADEATGSIPIIALTARAMTTDQQKAKEAGCDDFETKPVELARLLEKMQALLPQSATP